MKCCQAWCPHDLVDMITVGNLSFIEAEPSMYSDGWPGAVAITDDAPGLCGHGLTPDEAAADLADQFGEITWH